MRQLKKKYRLIKTMLVAYKKKKKKYKNTKTLSLFNRLMIYTKKTKSSKITLDSVVKKQFNHIWLWIIIFTWLGLKYHVKHENICSIIEDILAIIISIYYKPNK